MFKNKFNKHVFCVYIFYKSFRLIMKIKIDKNIINTPSSDMKLNILRAIRKQQFFKMKKKFIG